MESQQRIESRYQYFPATTEILVNNLVILVSISSVSPYSAIYDQAFKFRGDVQLKEFSCGSSNAVIILLSKAIIISVDFVPNVNKLSGSLTLRLQHTYPGRTWRARRGSIAHAIRFSRSVVRHR